jgi:glucose-6-phosphate isomerase
MYLVKNYGGKIMAITLNEKFLSGFVGAHELESLSTQTADAFATVCNRSGAGADFLGWVDLPVNYDKEEFARIQAAAEKIKADSEVLLVIGIGCSYLGSRAAIEFLRHNF